MPKIIVADNSERDAQRFRSIIEKEGLSAELCASGRELASDLDKEASDVVGLFILWELPGPPFGAELLLRWRKKFPEVPLVVVSSALDASLAARANDLGAFDFLEKPLDPVRVKSCLKSLLRTRDPLSSLVEDLKKRIIGDSLPLLSTLKQIARAIKHDAKRVLLIGDSGTGKELLAKAFHELGSQSKQPFVAVNITAVPKDLIESALFGHEKGAFTGAADSHQGYLEESGDGTLFLDELGDLELSLQVKLLRAIQEKQFRRLKGAGEIEFRARLVCATNMELAQAVKQGTFRQDLFHRVAEMTVKIPPLRNRDGDIDLLLDYFLRRYRGDRPVSFARETLSILRSYSYPGNVRELENFVRAALMECEDELILPKHLPLPTMGVFLAPDDDGVASPDKSVQLTTPGLEALFPKHHQLFIELARVLPENWWELPYKGGFAEHGHAFDRVYFARILERYHHNVTKAAKAAGIDKKTFAQHWKDAGLPPLRGGEGESDE